MEIYRKEKVYDDLTENRSYGTFEWPVVVHEPCSFFHRHTAIALIIIIYSSIIKKKTLLSVDS